MTYEYMTEDEMIQQEWLSTECDCSKTRKLPRKQKDPNSETRYIDEVRTLDGF